MIHLSRREFLQTIVATGVCAASGQAAERDKNEIIDTHTHFYDPTRPEGVPWPSKNDQLLYRAVLPEHFLKIATPLGVTGTVVVEASERVEDNQWVLDLAEKNPVLQGLVGRLEPGEKDFARNLLRFAGNPRFRGIRISHQKLKAGLASKTFLEDLGRLAEKSLVLDVNGGPDLLPDVARLANALPELVIVVNHLANVAIDGQSPPADWRKGMTAAAAHPRVYCKVSALVEGASRNGRKAPFDAGFYQPVLDVAWDAFGADRLMFGSNWPVSERAADYATVLQIAKADLSGRSTDASKFFAANARKVYRLP